MSRAQKWLLAAGLAFIGLGLIPIIFGETRRELNTVCSRCGVTQYDVYRVLTVFGQDLWMPTGTSTSGGRPGCSHEIRKVGKGSGDLLTQ